MFLTSRFCATKKNLIFNLYKVCSFGKQWIYAFVLSVCNAWALQTKRDIELILQGSTSSLQSLFKCFARLKDPWKCVAKFKKMCKLVGGLQVCRKLKMGNRTLIRPLELCNNSKVQEIFIKIIESRGDTNIWILYQILGFLLIFFIIYLKLRLLFRAKTKEPSLNVLCSLPLQIALFIVSWMNIHLWLTYVILWAKISTQNFN